MFICYFLNPIAILNHRTQMEKVTVDPTEVACMEAESYNVVERDGVNLLAHIGLCQGSLMPLCHCFKSALGVTCYCLGV